MANAYYKTELIGGGADALDFIDGASLTQDDLAFVSDSDINYIYILNATSGASESSPDVISPDTNAGTKRWILQPSRTATLTNRGIAELATDTETITGTDTGRVITPSNLQAKIANDTEAEAKTLTDKVICPANIGAMFLDEDDMASDSSTKFCSQQSIAAYVDTVRDVPTGETILFYKDTSVTGYSLEALLDDKLVYVTKGSVAGGETGGAAHSTGSWTLSGITVDAHTHTGPNHTHDYGNLRALIGWDSAQRINLTMVTDTFTATHRANITGGSIASTAQPWKTLIDGNTGTGGTANTGSASSSSITSGATWRPAGFNFTMQTRV